MQTLVINASDNSVARLELLEPCPEAPRLTYLAETPFRIGRGESCELVIASNHVSRVHAIVIRDGDGYRIQDQHSTNGTEVNGRRVRDAPLSDGDIVTIANLAFCFFDAQLESPSAAVTEVLDSPLADAASPRHTVLALRRLQRAATRLQIPNIYRPIVGLESQDIEAWEFVGVDAQAWEVLAGCRLQLKDQPWNVATRLRSASRRRAVLDKLSPDPGSTLLIGFSPCEANYQSLAEEIANLCDLVSAPGQIAVQLPIHLWHSQPSTGAFAADLRSWGVRLADCDVDDTHVSLLKQTTTWPHFAKFTSEFTHRLTQASQAQQRAEQLVRAYRDHGVAVIAAGVENNDQAQICRDLGITLAQGDYLARGTHSVLSQDELQACANG